MAAQSSPTSGLNENHFYILFSLWLTKQQVLEENQNMEQENLFNFCIFFLPLQVARRSASLKCLQIKLILSKPSVKVETLQKILRASLILDLINKFFEKLEKILDVHE